MRKRLPEFLPEGKLPVYKSHFKSLVDTSYIVFKQNVGTEKAPPAVGLGQELAHP